MATKKGTLKNKNGDILYFATSWDKIDGKPSSLPASDVYDWAKAASKPGYTWDEITGKPTSFSPSSHTHDDRYYTETEIDTKLAGKSDTGHTHSQYLTSHQDISGKLDKSTSGRQEITSTANDVAITAAADKKLKVRTGGTNGWYAGLDTDSLTAYRTFSFPDKSGTIALLDDVAAFPGIDKVSYDSSYSNWSFNGSMYTTGNLEANYYLYVGYNSGNQNGGIYNYGSLTMSNSKNRIYDGYTSSRTVYLNNTTKLPAIGVYLVTAVSQNNFTLYYYDANSTTLKSWTPAFMILLMHYNSGSNTRIADAYIFGNDMGPKQLAIYSGNGSSYINNVRIYGNFSILRLG